jgi:glycosyltransferase involved in cell wall biosynthesis
MKVFHVIPHAGQGGINRELDLLLTAPLFPNRGEGGLGSDPPRLGVSDLRVCCLAGDGPATLRWRGMGGNVAVLNWRRVLDPRPLWMLAAHLREWRPDVIHAWGLESLRAVRLAAPKSTAAIVVRRPIPSDRRPGRQLLSRWERWLLAGATGILASSNAEASRCALAGLPVGAIHVVPPGVRMLPPARAYEKPLIVCAGALQPHKGFYEAVWAFDILQFVHDTVELVVVGDGPQRSRLERFAGNMGHGQRIRISPGVPDTGALLAKAALVWVPSLTDNGAGMVLEAMAAGLAVVASRWPGLAELVVDGETGFLVEQGNKVELARQTRHLLEDAALRKAIGIAARRRAEQLFAPAKFVDSWNRAIQHVRCPVSDVQCRQA